MALGFRKMNRMENKRWKRCPFLVTNIGVIITSSWSNLFFWTQCDPKIEKLFKIHINHPLNIRMFIFPPWNELIQSILLLKLDW
jgi:hypothetical protein